MTIEPEILLRGNYNPLIVVRREQVLAWLRSLADEAGYADRETEAVQITVKMPFAEGTTFHHECPELILMVSNIPNSRTPSQPPTGTK